jgi:hypothetical protein
MMVLVGAAWSFPPRRWELFSIWRIDARDGVWLRPRRWESLTIWVTACATKNDRAMAKKRTIEEFIMISIEESKLRSQNIRWCLLWKPHSWRSRKDLQERRRLGRYSKKDESGWQKLTVQLRVCELWDSKIPFFGVSSTTPKKWQTVETLAIFGIPTRTVLMSDALWDRSTIESRLNLSIFFLVR